MSANKLCSLHHYILRISHLVEVNERVPEGVLGKDTGVADDDAPEASARKGHVEAAGVGKKTDALVLV